MTDAAAQAREPHQIIVEHIRFSLSVSPKIINETIHRHILAAEARGREVALQWEPIEVSDWENENYGEPGTYIVAWYGKGKLARLKIPPFDAALAPPAAKEVWQHKKRQSTYTVMCSATAQSAVPIAEGEVVEVYRSMHDGECHIRRKSEFHDGRFELTPAAPERQG